MPPVIAIGAGLAGAAAGAGGAVATATGLIIAGVTIVGELKKTAEGFVNELDQQVQMTVNSLGQVIDKTTGQIIPGAFVDAAGNIQVGGSASTAGAPMSQSDAEDLISRTGRILRETQTIVDATNALQAANATRTKLTQLKLVFDPPVPPSEMSLPRRNADGSFVMVRVHDMQISTISKYYALTPPEKFHAVSAKQSMLAVSAQPFQALEPDPSTKVVAEPEPEKKSGSNTAAIAVGGVLVAGVAAYLLTRGNRRKNPASREQALHAMRMHLLSERDPEYAAALQKRFRVTKDGKVEFRTKPRRKKKLVRNKRTGVWELK